MGMIKIDGVDDVYNLDGAVLVLRRYGFRVSVLG